MSTHEDPTTAHPPEPSPRPSNRVGAKSALLGATVERTTIPGDSSHVHARLLKARGGAAPRTALLRTSVAPPVRRANSNGTGSHGATFHGIGFHGTGPSTSHALESESESEHPLGFDPKEPLLTTAELDAFFGEPPPPAVEASLAEVDDAGLESPANSALETFSGTGPSTRPRWLRNQVADLADIVQTLELRARASHSHVGISAELARLRQFTRTIGYVAAPPPRGGQRFDVAVHVEEQLGGMVGDKPDAPRLLFKRDGENFEVVADKTLVAQAFEAILRTATGCCGAGDVVRVSVHDTFESVGPLARTTVEFPKGELAQLSPSEILEPYALKGLLPRVGAHALSAAGAIAVGQGGDLRLEEISGDRFAFALELPRAETPHD